MSWSVRTLVGLGLLGLLAGLASAFTMAAFPATVIGVTDGDTLTVRREGSVERVRVQGIDAPERGQPFATRAKGFLGQLAMRQVVTVEPTNRDRNGRLVAELVLPDGRRVSHEVVRAGFAWRRNATDPALAALEAEARAARRGLWADPHPIPPWEWRGPRA